jgi:signal transduction histidine kinase
MTAVGARASSWLQREDAPTRRRPLVHPVVVDVVLVLALVIIGTPQVFVKNNNPSHQAHLWAYLLEAALLLPLLWRRRWPVGVFAWLSVVAIVQLLTRGTTLADLALPVSVYTVATRCPRRVALAVVAATVVGVTIATLVYQPVPQVNRAAVFAIVALTAIFFLGTNLRTRRAYVDAMVERTKRLEQEAGMAAAAERASIAREMHDIVAHSLAVVITMADAAAIKVRTDPEQATSAIEQVADTGRQALADTRRVLGVLRTESGGLGPQPGVAQLDVLIDQARATGLVAELAVSGAPFPLPDGAQLAVYRIVQEALTNTMKHARDATWVRVSLQWAEPLVVVEIADDGSPPTDPLASVGHGLVGMRERAALYDGQVFAGPQPGRGWVVRASLDTSVGAAPRVAP